MIHRKATFQKVAFVFLPLRFNQQE